MGGKGRKRREKNFIAAHGVKNRRLPPPPVASSVDALPSKLRQLIKFTRSPQPGVLADNALRNKGDNGGRADKVDEQRNKGDNGGRTDKVDNAQRNKGDNADKVDKKSDSEENLYLENFDFENKGHNEAETDSTHEKKKKKKKKKRKRIGAEDLRFELAELTGLSSKRKERKKRRLEEMKNKKKKGNVVENLSFPGREKIKFGEVVKAPPKLVTVPKGRKSVQDASKERLRLEAVDAYRNRRGWASRPGINLPSPEVTSP